MDSQTEPEAPPPDVPPEDEGNVPPTKRPKKRKRPAADEIADEEAPTPAPGEEFTCTPWLDELGMTEYDSKEQRLHDEIVAFTRYIAPTSQERAARRIVISRIEKVITRRFKDAKVHVFGGVAQDLSYPDGDIDLMATTVWANDVEEKKKSLFQLAARLKSALITESTVVVHRATVPIVTFATTPDLGSLKVDLSINAPEGVQGAKAINEYLSKMPALRPLVLVVKGYLVQRNLHSAASHGLSSYCLICMTICFLRTNPYSKPQEWFDRPMESESLGNLLMDFLKFFADDFSYETEYVSAMDSEPLKVHKKWVDEKRPDRLVIQCLVRPEWDCARALNKLSEIRDAFREAYLELHDSPFPTRSRNTLSILGLRQKTLDFRSRIKELVESGSIDRAAQPPTPPAPSSNRGRTLPFRNTGSDLGNQFSSPMSFPAPPPVKSSWPPHDAPPYAVGFLPHHEPSFPAYYPPSAPHQPPVSTYTGHAPSYSRYDDRPPPPSYAGYPPPPSSYAGYPPQSSSYAEYPPPSAGYPPPHSPPRAPDRGDFASRYYGPPGSSYDPYDREPPSKRPRVGGYSGPPPPHHADPRPGPRAVSGGVLLGPRDGRGRGGHSQGWHPR